MSRIIDRSLLDSYSRYLDDRDSMAKQPGNMSSDQFARTHPHFVFYAKSELVYAVDRKNERTAPNGKSGNLCREVTEALKKHMPLTMKFEIYNEIILRDNSRLRAYPNYANSGPWYDFVNVSWEHIVNGKEENYLLPARCLCFFRRESETGNEYEIMALVHTVDQSSDGHVAGRPNTLLTRHYRMQYNNKGQPVTHLVPIASIDSAIRCFPHGPTKLLFDCQSPGITYLLPRNHWSYMWLAINETLRQSNSAERLKQRKGRLTSLCSVQWLELVRSRYHTYLNATCSEDLNCSV